MLLKKFEIQSLIANAAQLAELLPQIATHDRVAVDTEADSLHSYREKLCLLQLSLSGRRGDTDSSSGELPPGRRPLWAGGGPPVICSRTRNNKITAIVCSRTFVR